MSHLFVVRGDVTKIHCDAWLLPCDAHLRVTAGWTTPLGKRGVPFEGEVLGVQAPQGWGAELRAFTIAAGETGMPAIVATDTGGHRSKPFAWYLEGVTQFVAEVRRNPAVRRVALPFVGAGEGGKADAKGELLGSLLRHLHELALESGIEIVLVAHDAAAFAAAQAERRKHRAGFWPSLRGLESTVEVLALAAAEGRLVLFIGAGVSMEAGLPSWDELLWEMAREVGLAEDPEQFRQLPAIDRANVLEARLTPELFRQRVVDRLSRPSQYSLTHALLAGLPVTEAATTNYDDLFERAAKDSGAPVAVLPYESVRYRPRWLLKLHGDRRDPMSIVISRDDYLGYAATRRALSGIVQALLITKHMLFVGFSLRDDNFHQIAHDVRLAVRARDSGAYTEPFGTALLLAPDELRNDLWSRDLDLCVIAESAEEGRESLPVMLDSLLAEATTTADHLLHDSFDHLLTDVERDLRQNLVAIRDLASRADPAMAARLKRLLAEFGG